MNKTWLKSRHGRFYPINTIFKTAKKAPADGDNCAKFTNNVNKSKPFSRSTSLFTFRPLVFVS